MAQNLMQAHQQWLSRPDDERFTSLHDMQDHFLQIREHSRGAVVSSRRITAIPTDDNKGLLLSGPTGAEYAPTNWAFGQVAQLAEAPAGYLRTLPAPIAADCINYGLHYKRDVEEVGILLYKDGEDKACRAVTGPNYGRIWNSDIVGGLVRQFGDGQSGDWRVPGVFGQRVDVTKENTTLYASDRDMWVFLADETHRIEMPNRRNGEPGQLARGFFVWNSEVGSSTFGLATFLFDYVCANRIVWGAEQFQQFTLRHTSGAPDRFIEQAAPALLKLANSSTHSVVQAIEDARDKRINDVDDFLQKRFSKRLAEQIKDAHMQDEGRPIETLWDATTAITAHARSIPHQDERVKLEREGGKVLGLAK